MPKPSTRAVVAKTTPITQHHLLTENSIFSLYFRMAWNRFWRSQRQTGYSTLKEVGGWPEPLPWSTCYFTHTQQCTLFALIGFLLSNLGNDCGYFTDFFWWKWIFFLGSSYFDSELLLLFLFLWCGTAINWWLAVIEICHFVQTFSSFSSPSSSFTFVSTSKKTFQIFFSFSNFSFKTLSKYLL